MKTALYDNLMSSGSDIITGAKGIAEGMPKKFENKIISKFRDDGLHITSTGSKAGMFSAIISGWVHNLRVYKQARSYCGTCTSIPHCVSTRLLPYLRYLLVVP